MATTSNTPIPNPKVPPMINYKQQAQKDNPFDGLSESEMDKMKVYLNLFATPRMSDDEIFRKYGFISQLMIGEALAIASTVAQELKQQEQSYSSTRTSTYNTPYRSPYNSPYQNVQRPKQSNQASDGPGGFIGGFIILGIIILLISCC